MGCVLLPYAHSLHQSGSFCDSLFLELVGMACVLLPYEHSLHQSGSFCDSLFLECNFGLDDGGFCRRTDVSEFLMASVGFCKKDSF